MKISLKACDVITALHETGFTDDFALHGDNMLWVQKKIFLNADELMLFEYHRFSDAKGKETVVFGVVALYYDIKGILIKHYNDCIDKYRVMIENSTGVFKKK